MTFEEFLIGKKIDDRLFYNSEPDLYGRWKGEFGQMHPNSFAFQKLNLINPIRRKYPLEVKDDKNRSNKVAPVTPSPGTPASQAAKPGKPVIKPKPKTD